MAGSDYLPLELLHSILLRLPAKSLFRFQIVSKSWHDNIWDPHFIKIYMDQSRASQLDNRYMVYYESGFCGFFELDNGLRELFVLDCPFASPGEKIYPICSCNGVLLFEILDAFYGATDFVLWNPYPFAQKWRRVKSPYRAYTNSLCYDEASDDLKIVGFWARWGFTVYSCKNDTWELKFLPWNVDWLGESISFRGASYCMYRHQEYADDIAGERLATHIVRYDPSSDVLQFFRTPYGESGEGFLMATSKESLYFYVLPERWQNRGVYLRIWVMKDDYSWEQLMEIDYGRVEQMDWPMSLHFPNGRNDFIIETQNRDLYSVDINTLYKNIGRVPEDARGLMINHPMDTLYFPDMYAVS